MKTPVLKRTYRRQYARSATGSYKGRRTAALAKFRSWVPRTVFSPFPAQMNIQMTHVQQANYEAAAQTVNSFSIAPWSPVGLDGLYPPYFEELMRIYSYSMVKSAKVTVTFHALDQPNEALNMASGVITNRDSLEINLNQETMDKLRSMPGSKTGFLGTSNGGHDVVSMTHYVDMYRYSEAVPKLDDAGTNSRYNVAGNIVISPPASGLSTVNQQCPVVQFMYTPTQALPINFQVIRSITYNITFSGRHFG